ncbi:MAG: hypothetical protein NTV51_11295 [Verrucomicrobia bacterium]|nr:hypothetical protein [Verrucomicrobiota bacterium]
MSFLAPKTELPAGLGTTTPGRVTNGSPTEVLPMVHGRARLIARWQTPVLHWLPRSGSAGDYWHFSCLGWLCLGPVDEIRRVWVGDSPGPAYADFNADRSDYPGADYLDLTVSGTTPAKLRAYWGLETQASPAAYLANVIRNPGHPMAGKVHPRYRGICYIILQDVFAGVSTTQTPPVPKVEVEVYRRSPTAYSFGGIAWGTNPIGVVKDLLTAKRGGAKLPESYFDATHWNNAMQRVMDVGVAGKTGVDLFISPVFDSARPVGDQVADVLAYLGGHIRERNGKLQVDWSPADGSTASPAGLRQISEHERAGDLELDSTDIEAMKTKVVVNGLDYAADPGFSEASEDEQVPYAVQFIGTQRPPEAISRPFFLTRAQLKSYAKMQAVMLATPSLKATVPVLRQYATHPDGVTPLRPGDRFNLDDAEKGLDLVVRITERREDGAKVVFQVVGEPGAFPQPYQPALDPRADLTRPVVANLARYTVAQLPPDLSDAADTLCAALVERASNDTQSFDVQMSPTNAWPGQVVATNITRFAVCAVLLTTLFTGLADVTVTINTVGNDWSYLRSQSALEQGDDQLLMYRAGEWFSIGTLTPAGGGSYTLTSLKRARLGSLPTAHAVGSVMFIIGRNDLITLSHAEFSNLEFGGVYNAGVATKWFKLRPNGAGGVQGSLTAAFSLTLRDPTPDAPAGLTATVGTGKLVDLKWTAVTAALVNEYSVWRATGPSFLDEAQIGSAEATDKPRFIDIGVVLGTQYRYRVRAHTTDESVSGFSGTVLATPGVIAPGMLDHTLPGAATAPTLAGGGTYLTDDGAVMSYLLINVGALPANAVCQFLLWRRNGVSAGNPWSNPSAMFNTVAKVIRLDDLAPGLPYDVAMLPVNYAGDPGAEVFGTSSPFTAPGKTSLPSAPTAGSLAPDTAAPAVKSDLTAILYGCKVSLTLPADRDIVAVEIKATSGDADDNESYTWTDWGVAEVIRRPVAHPLQIVSGTLYAPTPIVGYVRARCVDSSGNASAWLRIGNANTAAAQALRNMALQSSTNVGTTGITTGAGGSQRKVVARQPIYTALNLAGGVAQETIDFSISGFGFSTRPDSGWMRSSDYDRMDIRYDIDDSTSTNAKLRITMTDGSNVPTVTGMEATGEFIEYD